MDNLVSGGPARQRRADEEFLIAQIIEKELKHTSSNGINLRRDMKSQGDVNWKHHLSCREYSEKSSSNLPTKGKIDESMKQVSKSSSGDCRDQSSAN